jgi:2-polyprenyl-3-methyl-5-hydroxy-6-metoxy-1,4-benzoquinol methylase
MIKRCPLCGRSAFVAGRFGLLGCEECGLIVAAAVWRPDANQQLNDASFGDDYQPVSSFWVRWFEALSNRRRMQSIQKIGGLNEGELLEVGVGSGSFMTHAAQRGFSALGCDLSPAICRKVNRETGKTVHCGSVDSLPPTARFDVIVMHHLLEHVSDPIALLQAARARLRPGGTLQLAVPNSSAWEARLRGWTSYEPYHLLYFTPRTLQLTAERAGFTVLKVRTHESFSGWALAISRTLLGYSTEAPRPGASSAVISRKGWIEHAYRTALVTCGLVTLPLRRLQEWLGHGEELILVAKNLAHE